MINSNYLKHIKKIEGPNIDIVEEGYFYELYEQQHIQLLEQVAEYYLSLDNIIVNKDITLEDVINCEKQLNELTYTSSILIGSIGLRDFDIHQLCDKVCTGYGLSDSIYYMDDTLDISERLLRIANKELIDQQLMPNPNYQKIVKGKVIHYGDSYRLYLNNQLLDVLTNAILITKELTDKEKEKEYSFGILISLAILHKTLNVPITW